MEAKRKVKASLKQQDSSSDADSLSDFEEAQVKCSEEQHKTFFTPEDRARRLVVVLDNVCLETAQTKRGFELLNKDDHFWIIKKKNRDPETYRPDIVHQTLMALLDTPLSKQKKLQVFMRTSRGYTVEVSPDIRLPRTFKRFSGLFAQLMTQGRIQGSNGGQTLLQVSNYPIHTLVHKDFQFVKVNTFSKGNLVENLLKYTGAKMEELTAFVIDLTPSTQGIKLKYSDEICISNYDLSPLCVANKVCFAFEEHWGVL